MDMGAGQSAGDLAERSRLEAEAHRQAARDAERRARGFGIAARTEPLTARALESLTAHGYQLLHDRRWPTTRRANLDHLAVGPGGVFVIDTKSWRGRLSIVGGSLYQDQACRDDAVEKARDQALAVESVLVEIGLAPLEVVPVICLIGEEDLDGLLGRVHVVSLGTLPRMVLARGERLSSEQCAAVVERLDSACPHTPDDVRPRSTEAAPVVPRIVVPHRDEAAADALFDTDHLHRAAIEAAAREAIEPWMTFLHPDQARLVRRSFSGPCRFRGPAGTGKTVVALHRAAYLASTRPGPILFTSYVRTLPTVLRELYRRLSPDTVGRVEFTGLHAWASGHLSEAGIAVRLEPVKANTAFALALSRWRGRGAMVTDTAPPGYWQDEINHVIKGRGLVEFGEYENLRRVGRRTRLTAEQRMLVWELYERYNANLRARGIVDFNDVLILALDLVRRERESSFAAVIADEVQDLNLVGVQLLHALVGDRPDGLTLVGDGQQAIYPGGFTLAEAAIQVTGRAAVLKVNYRNSAAILDFASKLVIDDEFEDLGAELEQGRREVTTVRMGGSTPMHCRSKALPDHDEALLEGLRQAGVESGLANVAILVQTRSLAGAYRRLLQEHGIPAIALEDYDGTPVDAVKVGTFKRAKGLEFACVFMPQVRLPGDPGGGDLAALERAALERREHYVAMTRARDVLWVGELA